MDDSSAVSPDPIMEIPVTDASLFLLDNRNHDFLNGKVATPYVQKSEAATVLVPVLVFSGRRVVRTMQSNMQTPHPSADQIIIARRPTFSIQQIGGQDARAKAVFSTPARIPDSKATNSTSYLKIRMKKIIHFKNVFQRFLSKFSKINSLSGLIPNTNPKKIFQKYLRKGTFVSIVDPQTTVPTTFQICQGDSIIQLCNYNERL